MIVGGAGWQGVTGLAAWQQLAKASDDQRQPVRWRFALGLLGEGRGADALGVLEVMRQDDHDLELVPAFQLARGVALTLLGRGSEANGVMSMPALAANPEACAWRMRALAAAGATRDAALQINCAIPAINGRIPAERAPFVSAASGVAIAIGQPQKALAWLALFDDRDPAANILRGRAFLAQKDLVNARLRFERALPGAEGGDAVDARLGKLEVAIAGHSIAPADAIKQLDDLRYGWRGGPIEQHALELEYSLARDGHDLRAALRTGATLLRYFNLGITAAPMLAELKASLAALLEPSSGVPLPEAAGLYWDYRELTPAGGDGDQLVTRLADRLQSAGLYARAAELLQYQLTQRAQDVAQGPLSVRVATLQLLAGHPDLALDALHNTEQPSYTPEMRIDRKRMEAVALHRMGRDDAALAALDGLPDAALLRAEIQWRKHDWVGFVAETQGKLPPASALDDPQQAAVLRHAVALAMLGLEDRLQALRARYAAAFKPLATAAAFDMLTAPIDHVDPAKLAAAMAAIPAASPAGAVADLLDAGS